jgi:nucleoside-diphosphate-sugar epimerase
MGPPSRTLFLLGATGFIGGELLSYLHSEHGEKFKITLLVQSEERALAIRERFENVEVANGDLDSSDLLESLARAADVFLSDCVSVCLAEKVTPSHKL